MDKSNFNKNDFTVKVEVWTRYNADAVAKITEFTRAFNAFAGEVRWAVQRFEFKNNRK